MRYATGDFASGYLRRRDTWERLRNEGHELGWHMHLMSYDSLDACYSFDPEPAWLEDAFNELARYFEVRSTRTGWDACSNWLMRRLDQLGVVVDLSALPGSVAWHMAGRKKIRVDWLRAGALPYHPAVDDYQQSGSLRILEVPITGFPNSVAGMARRTIWRLGHGCFSMKGLHSRNEMLTQPWSKPPALNSTAAAFFFHPSDLSVAGIRNFAANLRTLRSLPHAEFVTASTLAASLL